MQIARNSHLASLLLLQNNGFSANTFIDIGAAEGLFFLSRRDFNLFPAAKHFFVDAMEENEPIYRKIASKFPSDYAITALSCLEGTVNVNIDPTFYNTHISSVQTTNYPNNRVIPVTTLDKLIAVKTLAPPYILKLDVQGAELDVLRGSLNALAKSTIVVAEIQIFFERDTLVELLSFMQANGFSLFDITEQGYYVESNVMYQCYATFIPSRMDFRKNLRWCHAEQEPAINAQLRQRRAQAIERINGLT